jgi:hypothetical protein
VAECEAVLKAFKACVINYKYMKIKCSEK